MTDREAQIYYDRRLNTYQYSVISKNCNANQDNDVFRFTTDIPPFPFPTHQASSLAIFRLKEFFIMNQGTANNQRASGDNTTDLSGFSVSVIGAGMRGSQYTNSNQTKLTTNNIINVSNKYAMVETGTHDQIQVLSGSNEMSDEIVISNPSGTALTFEVRDLRTFTLIPAGDGSYFSYIKFEVELLPPDVSSGN